jgi:hypothetical protein
MKHLYASVPALMAASVFTWAASRLVREIRLVRG